MIVNVCASSVSRDTTYYPHYYYAQPTSSYADREKRERMKKAQKTAKEISQKKKMSSQVQHIFIVSRAGGLIYNWEPKVEVPEVERTFNYPLDVILEEVDQKAVVVFGERNGIKLRYYVKAINDREVSGTRLYVDDQHVNIFKFLESAQNFPVKIKFTAPTMSTNEKLILSSTFHGLFTIAVQVSPNPKSSGIELLETSHFRLHCFQSRTGVKFVVVTSQLANFAADSFLSKVYELYADFALKNPFYSIDMPIRCHRFDEGVKTLLEKIEKSTGVVAF